jgi:hypothetical protein
MNAIITWLGFVTAIVALGYAWGAQRRLDRTERRLDRYNRALFDASDEIRKLREQLETHTLQIDLLSRQARGDDLISAEMTVRQAQMLHPQAQRLMASLGLGGCSSCADDSLGRAAGEHGVDLQRLIAQLHLLVATPTPSALDGLFQKTPNIELELDASS